MNEVQWNCCAEPQKMLTFLRGRATDRQLRLFAAACYRRIWHLLEDDRSQEAVTMLERYTESTASTEELARAARAAQSVVEDVEADEEAGINPYAAGAAANALSADDPDHDPEDDETPPDCLSNAKDTAFAAAWAVGHALYPGRSDDAWFKATKAEEKEQCCLLRCIIGPQAFRPLTVDTVWLTETVVSLAEAAYDARSVPEGTLDSVRLGIIADALEDAGAAGELVAHLRIPGPHVRGCHVLEAILGKK
jgi:hypothetical protein